MLKNVVFYFMEETNLEELIAELKKYKVNTRQVVIAGHAELEPETEPETELETEPEADIDSEEILCVTDSGKLCRLLLERQIPVVAYLREDAGEQNFGTVKYAVEAIEAVNYSYLRGVYQRYKGIPWEILETQRCLVREIMVEDVDTLYQLYKEPSMTVYMENLYPTVEAEKEYTRQYIENIYGFYEYGMWIVIEKESGCIIGRAGLEQRENEEEALELGYMIAKPYQRKGFAAEVCGAIVEYALTQLGISRIHSLIEKENIPSICLIQKLGFTLAGERHENGKDYLQYNF